MSDINYYLVIMNDQLLKYIYKCLKGINELNL